MSYRRMIWAALVTAAAMAALAVIAISRLPHGTMLPTHWDAAGTPDRFASASVALFLPVALGLGLSALFLMLPRLEPLQPRLMRSQSVLVTSWASLMALMALVEAMIAAPAFGLHPSGTWIVVATGVVMIAVGNVLPKSRPGFFVGIRTPWAIVDEDNWIATHRLGAWCFILAGLLLIVSGLFPMPDGVRQLLAIGAALVAVIPPVVWSWWLWTRSQSASLGGRGSGR